MTTLCYSLNAMPKLQCYSFMVKSFKLISRLFLTHTYKYEYSNKITYYCAHLNWIANSMLLVKCEHFNDCDICVCVLKITGNVANMSLFIDMPM